MNYPYANGTISAIESKILDKNKLYVLTKYDKSEFVKVLLAMNYGGKGDTVEELITAENERLKNLIDELTPCKEDTDLFFLVNDAQNIKILYKIKKYGYEKYNLLVENGSIETKGLKEAIIDDDFNNLDKRIKKLIMSINKLTSDDISPKTLSAIIDNEVYSYAIKNSNNYILKKYLIYRIDFNNVMSYLRSKNLHWNKEEYFKMFLDNGSISKEVFDNIYLSSKEEVAKKLEDYYQGKITKVLNKITSVDECQLEFERLMLDLMKEYKGEPLNIGPIIYYYLQKQAEAQNIRILYSLNKVELSNLM